MRRLNAILGTTLFLVLVPGSLAVYIPWLITDWTIAPPLLGFPLFRILGVLMIAAGAPLLLDCFIRFAIQGLGTPAPIAAPQRLVVTGIYRHTRNPMYVAVFFLTLGQALLFGSIPMLEYTLAITTGFIAFVLLYEEPTLRRKFGADYEQYRRHVPRWIPRLKPYNAPPPDPK